MRATIVAIIMVLSGLVYSPAHSDLSNDRYEYRISEQIRKVRANHDKPAVWKGRCVDRHAERYNRVLKELYPLVHSNVSRLLYHCDADYAGEILARGQSMTPRAAVRAWMRSDSHRHALLNKRYDRIGVGAGYAPNGARVVTVNFIGN